MSIDKLHLPVNEKLTLIKQELILRIGEDVSKNRLEDLLTSSSRRSNSSEAVSTYKLSFFDKGYLYTKYHSEIYQILFSFGAGFVELNNYKDGTHLIFSLRQKPFPSESDIIVSCPGVNEIKLTVGDSYYLGQTKYSDTMTLEERRALIMTPRKLKEITFNGEYSFHFEGLEEPVTTFTRGHCESKRATLHRLDYTVIDSNKTNFLNLLLKKVSLDFPLLSTDPEYKKKLEDLNTIIFSPEAPMLESIFNITFFISGKGSNTTVVGELNQINFKNKIDIPHIRSFARLFYLELENKLGFNKKDFVYKVDKKNIVINVLLSRIDSSTGNVIYYREMKIPLSSVEKWHQ